MAHALGKADRWWLLAGFGAYGVVEICAGVRWQLLLRVQGIALSWTRVFMLLLIGVFFNFIIPGGTGGDVVKIFYLLKETPGQTHPGAARRASSIGSSGSSRSSPWRACSSRRNGPG